MNPFLCPPFFRYPTTKHPVAGGRKKHPAINRAMKTIPGNSVVGVLTTSHRLLGHPARARPVPDTGNPTSSASTVGDGVAANDVFVAYEVLRSAVSVPKPVTTNVSSVHSTPGSSGKSASAANLDRNCGDSAVPGELGTRYDEYGHVRGGANRSRQGLGLLVTAASPPFRSAAAAAAAIVGVGQHEVTSPFSPNEGSSAADCDQDGLAATVNRAQTESNRAEQEGDEDQEGGEAEAEAGAEAGTEAEAEADGEEASSRRSTWSPPPRTSPPAAAPRRLGAATLSDIAPLPLLVFDVETFHALGELDEAFAFQGGVAEWISRAGSPRDDGHGGDADDSARCTPRRRMERRPRAPPTDDGSASWGSPSTVGGVVLHSHEVEWGERFLGSWPASHHAPPPEVGQSTAKTAKSGRSSSSIVDGTIRPTGPAATPSLMGASDPNVNRARGDDPSSLGGTVEGGTSGQGCGCGSGGCGEQSCVSDQPTGETTTIAYNKWSRLPLGEELEALVQADADLFFLPMLLAESPPGEE